MTIEQTIMLVLEKGITTFLAGLVIYVLIQCIKYAPRVFNEIIKVIADSTKATENSTEAIEKSNELQKDTKSMHTTMDKKLDKLQNTVEELKTEILLSNGNSIKTILEKLNEVSEDVKSLKNGDDEY